RFPTSKRIFNEVPPGTSYPGCLSISSFTFRKVFPGRERTKSSMLCPCSRRSRSIFAACSARLRTSAESWRTRTRTQCNLGAGEGSFGERYLLSRRSFLSGITFGSRRGDLPQASRGHEEYRKACQRRPHHRYERVCR